MQQVTLSPSHVLIIARSFVAGLAYLHEPGVGCYKPPIAHRDIKASNVLLRPDFTACLADFDLAVAFTCDADGQLTANTLQVCSAPTRHIITKSNKKDYETKALT